MVRLATVETVRIALIHVRRPRTPTSSPYTTLFRSNHAKHAKDSDQAIAGLLADLKHRGLLDETLVVWGGEFGRTPWSEGDRKSTRLNSSHLVISYAVFCLKKKDTDNRSSCNDKQHT